MKGIEEKRHRLGKEQKEDSRKERRKRNRESVCYILPPLRTDLTPMGSGRNEGKESKRKSNDGVEKVDDENVCCLKMT